jgi:hypothetical protein
MTVLRMPCNFGVAASWNLAVRMGHRDGWVMVVSDDVTFPAGALAGFVEKSGEDRLVVSGTWPHWCAFTIGMRVVQKVGMFDEGYYPAYFEDTEYERRMSQHGMSLTHGPACRPSQRFYAEHVSGAEFHVQNKASHAANAALYASGKPARFRPVQVEVTGMELSDLRGCSCGGDGLGYWRRVRR